jgi:glycosyltransferase involved in cell wall biosynthesis
MERVNGVDFLWLRTPEYKKNGLARIINMAYFACCVWWRKSMYRGLQPDVVVGSSPTLFSAFASERLARRYRVPFVLEVRDLWPQSLVELANISSTHPAIKALAMLERYLYRRAHQIVTLLPNVHEHMVAQGASADTIKWLPNGVKLLPLESPTRVRTNRPFIALYAGAHGTANALDSVLDAAARLQEDGWGNQIRILMVGNGPQKPRLQARVKAECLSTVEFCDQVPKTEVSSLLSQADALLLPLRDVAVYSHGISPNKLFHYMASARPIILAAVSSNNPVDEARCGFTVPPENPASLAEALKLAARLSPEQRNEMGMRGRAYVERHHDVEILSKQLEDLLMAVCKTSSLAKGIPTAAS